MKTPREILEVNDSASEGEIKKAYRKLAAKYHPDVNKEQGSEDKFKEITKAYESLTQNKNEISTDVPSRSWRTVNVSRIIHHPPLTSSLNLSIAESALGCKKTIQVSRHTKCSACEGQGGFFTVDACEACKGTGRRNMSSNGNGRFIVVNICHLCEGIGKSFNKCASCSGQGTVLIEVSFDVSIPGGVNHGQAIRLGGGGHYESSPLGQGYGDAFISLSVTSEKGMNLDGINVISTVEISLLEALQGVNKTVNTIHGESVLIIPPLSKNRDQVIKKGFGAKHPVQGTGDHVCILDVSYPSNVNGLVTFLKDQ